MNNIKLASALWLQTRSLKPNDLTPLIKQSNMSLKQWESSVNNLNLKYYIKSRPNWIEIAKKHIEQFEQNNISYCYWGDKNYYKAFKDLDCPPLFYSYKGDIDLLNQKKLTVVGSRSPSEESINWLEIYFYKYLKDKNITVVSGAARGIDQLSHKIACLLDKAIISVFPSGLGQIYPRSYQRQPSSQYLFFSEYSYYDQMKRHYFVQRNRILALLGDATFVVEARRKSGSLITANYAANLGKTLAVLPSCPMHAKKLGGLDLLFDGAIPVRDHIDLEFIIS